MVRRHLQSKVISLVVVSLSVLALASPPADGAVPVAGLSYSGNSAHGLYSITVATSCVANDTTVSAVCAQPLFVNVTVTPTAKLGSRCDPYGGLAMGYTKLKAGGTFSVSDDNPDNYDVAVSGHFATSRVVEGTIKNIGFGCASDVFSVSIPAPVSSLSPCEVLVKTNAAKVIDPSVKADITANTFSTTSGECYENLGTLNSLELVYSTSKSTLPVEIGGLAAVAVPSVGPGATLYDAADGNSLQAVFVIHRGTSWAGLTYDFQVGTCPSSTPPGGTCISKGVQASIRARLASVAKKIVPLL